MNNDLNNETTLMTDPITGETYSVGNPHKTIGSQSVHRTSVTADPLPRQTADPLPHPVERPAPKIVQRPAQMTVRQNTPREIRIPDGVTKFCEHCGSTIAKDAVVCPACGCQVAALRQVQAQPIIINNQNVNSTGQPIAVQGSRRDKWVAFFLCLFLGYIGAHRFYEGKPGTGLLYFFTGGLFGIGWIVDIIRIAASPNPYYVN